MLLVGCCPFLRRALLEDVKLPGGEYYANAFFAYGEDTDLWFRAQLGGWRCLYQPSMRVWHVFSGSVGGKMKLIDKPPFFQFHALKNRYLMIMRNYPAALLVAMLPYLVLAELLIPLYLAVVAPRLLSQLPRVWWYLLRSLPRVQRERAYIQSRRVVSSAYLQQFFVCF